MSRLKQITIQRSLLMDTVALRKALAKYLGPERFAKFVKQLGRKGRLRFWQEQVWREFTQEHPEFVVGGTDLGIALRICELHGRELEPATVPVSDGCIDYTREYVQIRNRLFPNAGLDIVSSEGATLQEPVVEIWFCPECRAGRVAWERRHPRVRLNRDIPTWDHSHDWVVHRFWNDLTRVTIRFARVVPSVAEMVALRKCLPQFQHVAPAALRATIGDTGELSLGDMPTMEARPLIEHAKTLGLFVTAEGATIVSYIPFDRTLGLAWLIEDEALATAVAHAMIAAGVPVQDAAT